MMKTVPVLLPGSGRAAVRVRGILKGLLIASIDHWPSSLWNSAKKVRGPSYIYMRGRMQDQRKLYDQVETLTVIRRSTDSRKASSSARDFKTSASQEMLIRIVKAFFAMG